MALKEFALPSGQTVKLGRIRLKAAFDAGNFRVTMYDDGTTKVVPRLAAYLSYPVDTASGPPDVVDYSAKAAIAVGQMYLNDQYGDCVIASKMHQLGIWAGNESGKTVLATDNEVLSQYEGICGPGDNGCVITEVLDVMKSKGLTAGGKVYKIDDYVAVDWTNIAEVKMATFLFGSKSHGINLPADWLNTSNGGKWDVTHSRIVGGHDVCSVGYNAEGVVICTWGGTRTITWAAFTSTQWLEECYAELAPLWYENANLAPCGLDVEGLKADLALLAAGQVPPMPTPPGPSPIPPVPPSPPIPPSPPVPTPPAPTTAPVTGIEAYVTGGVLGNQKHQVVFTNMGHVAIPSPAPVPVPPGPPVPGDIATIKLPNTQPDTLKATGLVQGFLTDVGITHSLDGDTLTVERPGKLSPAQWAAIIALILQVVTAIIPIISGG